MNKTRAVKHVAIYSAGTIIRQLTGFIMLPIYTSYLTPADYGVVSLLVVMALLFEVFLGARFTQAVPKYYLETDDLLVKKSVMSSAFFMTTLFSFLAATIVYVFSSELSGFLFGTFSYSQHIGMYSLVILTSSIESYGLVFFRLQERPLLFVINSILKLLVQLSLNIYFIVHLEIGVLGVVYSAVISSVLFALISAVYICWHNGFLIRIELIVKFFKYCWPLWLEGLAGLYIGSSNRFFIRVFSDLTEVGFFELASKFAAILLLVSWNPFSEWWRVQKFKVYRRDDRGRTTYPVVFDGVTSVFAITTVGLCLLVGPVLDLMATPDYAFTRFIVPFLALSVIIESLTTFYRFSFLITEKTHHIAKIKYLSACVVTLLYISLIPLWGAVGAAIANLITAILVLYLTRRIGIKLFDAGINLGYSVKVLLFTVGFICVDFCLQYWINSVLLSLALKLSLILMFTALLWHYISRNQALLCFLRELKVEITEKFKKSSTNRAL